MSEISSIQSQTRILSKPKVTLEGTHAAPKEVEISTELQELKQFEAEIKQAFAMAFEIKNALEKTLKDLS